MDTSTTTRTMTLVAPEPKTPQANEQPGKHQPDAGTRLPPAPAIRSVERAVRQINTYLAESKRALDFQFHEATGRTVIRVVNPVTDEVIREIPPEEALRIAAEMHTRGLNLVDWLA